eukprot:scaffold3774_cov137-Alexandrium_tamarense.AAC.4
MLSLPFTYGFVNERWTKEIDVMLAKEKGDTQIHKNRLIGLLEADFNTALKWYYPVILFLLTPTLPGCMVDKL